jgi:hypothetical protein
MPILAVNHHGPGGDSGGDLPVDQRQDPLASGHAEAAEGIGEVVLNVHHQQGGAGGDGAGGHGGGSGDDTAPLGGPGQNQVR